MKSIAVGLAEGMTRADADSAFSASNEFEVQQASIHRRHGGPFPLPRLKRGVSCSEPILSLKRMTDRALASLNGLVSSSASFPKTNNEPLTLTSVQRWIVSDVSRRISTYGACPADLTEDVATKELGRGANLYGQEANSTTVVEMDLSKIKILGRHLHPTDAHVLAPAEVQNSIWRILSC